MNTAAAKTTTVPRIALYKTGILAPSLESDHRGDQGISVTLSVEIYCGKFQHLQVVDSALVLGNPFDQPARWRRAQCELLSCGIGNEVSRLLTDGDIPAAKQLILAIAHAQACKDPNGKVLGTDILSESLARKLPRKRRDYARIALAAGRCYQQLQTLRGGSSAMQKLRRETWAACFGKSLRHMLDLEPVIRDHDVVVFGETGTGKDLVAHAVQVATPGDATGGPAPSAAINAAAIPDSLVESELFGHVKGAFTGATEARAGRLRTADGGSFFLDEVGDLPRSTQVKLLRVIETDSFYPVGSDDPHHADVRYVAATHKNLEAMVERGEFRKDLFQRLAGIVIRIPALRDRPDDIVEIGTAFIQDSVGDRISDAHRKGIEDWLHHAADKNYNWPGNIRELQNALRNLLLDLDPGVSDMPPPRVEKELPKELRDNTATLEQASDWYVARIVDTTGDNISQAAKILDIDRSTVRRALLRFRERS